MDFYVVVGAIAMGVTALEAQTWPAIPFGQLQDDDFLLLERTKKVCIAFVPVLSLHVLGALAAAAAAYHRL